MTEEIVYKIKYVMYILNKLEVDAGNLDLFSKTLYQDLQGNNFMNISKQNMELFAEIKDKARALNQDLQDLSTSIYIDLFSNKENN